MGDAILVKKSLKPVTLKTAVKFSNDLKARDKILRLAQYSLKVVVYRLLSADPKSDSGKRLEALSKGIGLHRKAFKVGSWADEIQKLQELVESGKSDTKTQLSILLRACMGIFLVLDNLVWLASLKVVSMDKDGLKMKSYRFRLTAAIINAVIGYLDIKKQASAVKKAANEEDRTKALEKQGENYVGMVKNVFDVVTYMNSTKYLSFFIGSNLNDDVAGLIGSVSSAAALYGIWMKM